MILSLLKSYGPHQVQNGILFSYDCLQREVTASRHPRQIQQWPSTEWLKAKQVIEQLLGICEETLSVIFGQSPDFFVLMVDEGAEAGHTWALISRNRTQALVSIQLPAILVGGKNINVGKNQELMVSPGKSSRLKAICWEMHPCGIPTHLRVPGQYCLHPQPLHQHKDRARGTHLPACAWDPS